MSTSMIQKDPYAAVFGAEDPRFSGYFSNLKAISDVGEKFNFFDRITTEELSSPSFQVLTAIGKDLRFHEMCKAPNFSLGYLNEDHLISIASTVRRCKQLSNALTTSLKDTEKAQIGALCGCGSINMYIDSKIFKVLSGIIFSKNSPGAFSPTHPFNPINELMMQILENNHESLRSPKVTQITIRCDTGLGNALFIRGAGPGMSWDKGIPLTNKGGDQWVYEVRGEFGPFEYKILRNDTQWEVGENHQLGCGKNEERVLK